MDTKFYPPQPDPDFDDKVVQEVKSQGIFDEFRRDFIADVDTKPAYQNLRAKVESTTIKFLEGIEFRPDMNKHQLRERLRKHVEETTGLEIDLSRLVDQVVNPKIETVIRPKVEEVGYALLGMQPPKREEQPDYKTNSHTLSYNGKNVPLKVETGSSLLPTDLEQISPDSDGVTVKSECKDETESVHHADEDDSSPPFEPLEAPINKEIKVRTELDSQNGYNCKQYGIEKQGTQSLDVGLTQESQLSRVSSDSRLTPIFSETQRKSMENAVAANISEEAQMPKFNENSNDTNASQKLRDSDLHHFDIKKDEIKFEGTERKSGCLFDAPQKKDDNAQTEIEATPLPPNNGSFNGAPKQVKNTYASGSDRASQNSHESSFGSSLDDTSSAQMNKLKIDTGTENTEPPPSSKTPSVKAGSAERSNSCRKSAERECGMSESKERHSQSHSHSLAPSHSSSSSSRYKKHLKHSPHPDSSSHKRHHSSRDNESNSRQSSHHSKRNRRSASRERVRHSSSSSTQVKKDGEHRDRRRYRDDHKYKERSRERERHDRKDRDRKTKSNHDDHNLSKDKYRRRKSNDSNDGDQKRSGHNTSHQSSKSGANHAFSSSGSHSRNRSKSQSRSVSDANTASQNETLGTNYIGSDENANETHKKSMYGNVILLNKFLDNPKTDCIELNSGTCVQIMQSSVKPVESVLEPAKVLFHHADSDGASDSVVDSDKNFYGFPASRKFDQKAIDQHLVFIREFTKEFEKQVREGLDEKESVDEEVEKANADAKKSIECSGQELIIKAQVLLSCNESKTSPALSDSSVNSKENEMIDKNAVNPKKSVSQRKVNASNKLSTQRYTSEDLYKPRPVLSQRSRRRELH